MRAHVSSKMTKEEHYLKRVCSAEGKGNGRRVWDCLHLL